MFLKLFFNNKNIQKKRRLRIIISKSKVLVHQFTQIDNDSELNFFFNLNFIGNTRHVYLHLCWLHVCFICWVYLGLCYPKYTPTRQCSNTQGIFIRYKIHSRGSLSPLQFYKIKHKSRSVRASVKYREKLL